MIVCYDCSFHFDVRLVVVFGGMYSLSARRTCKTLLVASVSDCGSARSAGIVAIDS